MGKDFKTLTDNLGTEAVPKQYGGELPVPDVNGKLLAEFLKLFKDQFKCKAQFCLVISRINKFSSVTNITQPNMFRK